MAGRGRGRGKSLSFNVEALGFGRGEALPGPIQQPPPLYPPLELKPVSLIEDESHAYLLALKQEFRSTVKDLPYFIQTVEKKKDIQRYSDKYQSNQQDSIGDWKPDWRRFPAELKPRRKVKRLAGGVTPNLSKARKSTNVDISKTLEELEKKEVSEGVKVEGPEEGDEEEKDEEALAEEDLYEEDDMEEETDYNMTYFDNGELYGNDDEDDALDDGPLY